MPVRNSPRRTLLILLIITLTLAACNVGATPAPTVDVNAINTAAHATAMAQISAQLTQTALAAPSNTPFPTDTPLSLATSALPTAGGPTATGGVTEPSLHYLLTTLPQRPSPGSHLLHPSLQLAPSRSEMPVTIAHTSQTSLILITLSSNPV